jgi:hypothetical protein
MINREHKDRLFKLIFGEEKNKGNLLDLYNAINNTDYDDVSQLQIMTIEDCIYMGMKNDISLLIDFWLSLYEQQSTWNPNIPVRGMFYFADLYEKYIAVNKLNIYGSRLLKLPTPQYIVFYNGVDGKMDGRDEVKLRLSDAFGDKSVAGEFEWTATVKNINLGRNKELMEKCRPLMEYATLVDKIRRYKDELGSIEAAVERAVGECIKEGILADFLIGHKAEVMDVCLTEYDEAATQKAFKEEGYEEGYDDGYGSGYDSCENTMVRLQSYLIENNRLDDLRRTTYDKEYRNLLISKLPND